MFRLPEFVVAPIIGYFGDSLFNGEATVPLALLIEGGYVWGTCQLILILISSSFRYCLVGVEISQWFGLPVRIVSYLCVRQWSWLS